MTRYDAVALDDPWTVKPNQFPAAGSRGEMLAFATNYAVLAPSILNTEPWRFRISGDAIDVLADRSRHLPITDPQGRELIISCGAALLNLRVALHAFGCAIRVEIHANRTDARCLATVTLTGRESPGEIELRDAVTRRRTNRGTLTGSALPADMVAKLKDAAGQEHAAVSFIENADERKRVGELVAEAESALLSEPSYRSELADWILRRLAEGEVTDRDIRGPIAGRGPDQPFHADHFPASAASIARTYPPDAEGSSRRSGHLTSAPTLALLTTARDTSEHWLAAGQALQRVLLTATAANLAASFLNPPVEVAALRPKLKTIFGAAGAPQILLRLGHGTDVAPAPRRPVREVLEEATGPRK